MTRLSEIFGRRNDGTGDKVIPLPAMPARSNGAAEPPRPESVADIGARMGEENEGLRNLLTDAGRRIGELDELKQAFDRLVTPFNATLRALETEKSLTLSLSGRLEEQRTASDRLRADFYAADKKANLLACDADRLRRDLELARETARALEGARAELTEALKAAQARNAAVERQLEHESAQHQALAEARHGLQDQIDKAERRIVELEGESAAARERLVLLTDEKGSLQTSLDHALAEIVRLTRRLTDSDNTVAALRAQLGRLETSYGETSKERGRLAALLDDTKDQTNAERNALTLRIEALQSRAATAERLLAETRQSLIARSEEVRTYDRKAVEATIARGAAERRLAEIDAAQQARQRQAQDVEATRTALAERNAELTKIAKARETALARAETMIGSLNQHVAQLEAELQSGRNTVERRIEELTIALERERLERAVVEGALDAARKENTRLQGELGSRHAGLRRNLGRDGGAAGDHSVAAPAASGDAKTVVTLSGAKPN